MQVKLVIDAIVRHTTVLIAQLATRAGMRAPLAHVANQTFLALTGELERQGLGQKVIADMFGLALRSYQQKVQRLSESATERGRSLWEAVHDYLDTQGVASRADVLLRFARDDQASVRGILNDMTDTGLIFRTGRGDATVYRMASAEEIARASRQHERAAIEALVWVTIYREGPLGEDALCAKLGLGPDAARSAIQTLVDDGRVTAEPGAVPRYRSSECRIELGTEGGWEASLLDHYQALVSAMCAKLERGTGGAVPDDRIGGSTYAFDVWPGHPQAAQVYGLLAEHRRQLSELWQAVSTLGQQPPAGTSADRVTFYFGQLVRSGQGDTQPTEQESP